MTDGRARHPFLCFAAFGALLLVGGVVASHRLQAAPPKAAPGRPPASYSPRETAPSPPKEAPPAHVIGIGNFSHIVANLDRSLTFYREGLGLEAMGPVRPFEANEAIMRAANVMGAQTRYVVLKVPGSTLGVELIEYSGIDRQPVQPRFQDPGAGNLTVSVRDLDLALAHLTKAGARVITIGGAPTVISGRARVVFLQDPDGFVIELNQPSQLPASTEHSENVLGAGFETAVADTDKTVAFYRDLLGFHASVGASFNGDKLMADTAGTPGAQFRQSRLEAPDVSLPIGLIEFKGINRKSLSPRLQDPGMSMLQVMVRDLDTLLKTLKAGGAAIVSVDGEPVTMGPLRLAVVRDPNNLFLELIERQ
jgi:catechol 2,3-dioxygenase-like lactoylglutathione lyase family enzyme